MDDVARFAAGFGVGAACEAALAASAIPTGGTAFFAGQAGRAAASLGAGEVVGRYVDKRI